MRISVRLAPVLVIAIAWTAIPGCKKDAPAAMDEDTQARVRPMLANADAVDGKTDKVVSKCAACALGMDGKSKHAIKTAGYTMHFCSDMCREHFADGLSDNIMAMNVPNESDE